jgi:hypothetical protein
MSFGSVPVFATTSITRKRPPTLSRAFRELSKNTDQATRVLTLEVQRRAFGAPGEPGDPARIQRLAAVIVVAYDGLMQTAAEVRNQVVPDECSS